MSIQVSCPSCKSAVYVDEGLAGKDILCPTCQERLTVPSISAGRPENLPDELDDDMDEGRGEPGRRRMPRYQDEDDDGLGRRGDASRWNATVTGLGLIFWTSLVFSVLVGIMAVVGLVMGQNPQVMMMGNPGAAPPPEAVAFGLGIMLVGCAVIILAIIIFVGMCMCCTVPAESGAKGRAITTVVLLVLGVFGAMIAGIALGFQAMQQMKKLGGPPQPGQFPIAPTTMIVFTIVGGLVYLLIVACWLLFHKAIADYFHNSRLARHSMGYLAAFAVYLIVGNVLQFIAQPALFQGNVLAPPNLQMMIVAQIWGVVWLTILSVWFLYIVRETRRTILEDQGAAERGENRDDDRDY